MIYFIRMDFTMDFTNAQAFFVILPEVWKSISPKVGGGGGLNRENMVTKYIYRMFTNRQFANRNWDQVIYICAWLSDGIFLTLLLPGQFLLQSLLLNFEERVLHTLNVAPAK